ncbi:MotE family protein [Methylocystis sp. S23]
MTSDSKGFVMMSAFGRAAFFPIPLCLCAVSSFSLAAEEVDPRLRDDARQICADIAASAEAVRLDRRRKELAALEGEIEARLSLLEAKQQELRVILERFEAFERKTSDALVGLYSRMKPEAAAAQLAQLDEEVAAALMLQLKTKASSAILGEMQAAQGAALARRIAGLRHETSGKKP